MNQQEEGYTIKIKQFEGPFDLLLFFIERDEIDILDIPISKITADFLAYIRQLEELNIDCLLYTSPSPRDQRGSRMPSSA